MPGVSRSEEKRAAGPFEVWAARAWNVFNEGRPFSVVYPLLVLLAAAPLGLAPAGPLGLALLGAGAAAALLSRFPFALRGRALLWLAALVALPLLEPWRAPTLLAGALAGYAFFTVVVWGSVYYHLRTGAPWTNGLRFWRLVLTNSDPTSGNALEQLPKLLIALSAATLLAEEPGAGSLVRIAAALALAAGLGAVAARSFARRLPSYPERGPVAGAGAGPGPARLRDRRGRLQPRPPLAGGFAGDGPARAGGQRVPRGGAGLSGADGRVLLVDAHRGDPRRARHALQLRAAFGGAQRVDLRRARARGPQWPARGDRAPARPLRRGRGPLGHLGAADLGDRPLARGGGPARRRGGGPGPARAPTARRRPARPRARRAQPRIPRPARRD